MANLNNETIESILEKTIFYIKGTDIFFFCNESEVTLEFLKVIQSDKVTKEKIIEVFLKHKENISKENIIVISIQNCKNEIKKLSMELDKIDKEINFYISANNINKIIELTSKKANIEKDLKFHNKSLKKLIALGKDIKKCVVRYGYDSRINEYDIDVVDSQEAIKGISFGNEQNLKRLYNIDQMIKSTNDAKKDDDGIEKILRDIVLTDYKEIFIPEAKEIPINVIWVLIDNEILKTKNMKCEDLEKVKELGEGYYEDLTREIFSNKRELIEKQKEMLIKYIQYVDIDKLLLLCAYRMEEALEERRYSNEENLIIRDLLEKILKNIIDDKKVHKFLLQKTIDDEEQCEEVQYSVKDIKECIKRFIEERYFTKEYIQNIKERTKSGEKSLTELTEEEVEACISKDTLEDLALLNDDNFIFVSEYLSWEKEKILSKIKSMGKCSDDLFGYIVWKSKCGILAEDILDLYMNNIIDKNQIRIASFAYDFSTILNEKELLKLYNEKDKDENASEKYEKYITLYKLILTKDKAVDFYEHSDNLMAELTENFDLKNTQKHIRAIEDFYKRGILSIDAIVEWNDEEIIKNEIEDLYADQSLELDEVKDLLKKRKIPFEFMSIVVFNEGISYEERKKILLEGWVPEEEILKLYTNALIRKDDLIEFASKSIITVRGAKKAIQNTNILTLEANSNISLNINSLKKIQRDESIYATDEERASTGERNLQIIDPNAREELFDLLHACIIPRKAGGVEVEKESPFYNYKFYGITDEKGKITEDSIIIAERIYEDIDTETRFAVDNATYFFKYGDLLVLSNYEQKGDIIKQINNMVFRVNHCTATEERRGSWGKGVVEAVVKTMLSSDLKEFNRRQKNIKIFEILQENYTSQEVDQILDKVMEIDYGDYTYEIIDGGARRTISTGTGNTSCDGQPNNGDAR